MSTQVVPVPGYTTGRWAIDPVHSEVAFTVRHLGVAKVRGRFERFEGHIVTAEDPLESQVTATIHTASISTGNQQRDEHVRSDDFLAAATHPTMTFTSTRVRPDGEGYLADGELTLCGVTRPVTLALEVNGIGTGLDGKPVAGVSASAEINRTDFGVTGGPAGAVVGETVRITLEIEANKQD